MSIKKGLIDTVTQSGWWRQQRDDSKGPTKTPGMAESLKKTAEPTTPSKEDENTEGTITRTFSKLDFFKS